MTKRICWKKGMRLSDEIMKASDNKHAELVGHAFVLATAGRFGLFPASRPFGLSLNISGEGLDIVALSCLAITKGGQLIDINYDTKYTCPFDRHVSIPANGDEKEYLLVVSVLQDKWKETIDGYEEQECAFSLVPPRTPIPSNAIPIGRIVNDYSWMEDNVDFVPPCLFVSSHPKYQDLLSQFYELLTVVDTKAKNLLNSNGKDAIRIFWPITQQLMISVDKERDLMTPMTLLSNVQKFVSAFTCACELDGYLKLKDADKFMEYIHAPYNYENAYRKIKEGLDICISINDKLDLLSQQPVTQSAIPTKIASPILMENQKLQECKTIETSIPISYEGSEATLFFTTDGSDPTIKSDKASKTRNGYCVKFDNGFRQEKGNEPDKTITLKLMAMKDGICSNICSYQITLHKSIHFRKYTFVIK